MKTAHYGHIWAGNNQIIRYIQLISRSFVSLYRNMKHYIKYNNHLLQAHIDVFQLLDTDFQSMFVLHVGLNPQLHLY
jgi:hypothetical protein